MEKSLNNFWSYIDNYYLRKPSLEQVEKLAQMKALIEDGAEGKHFLSFSFTNFSYADPSTMSIYSRNQGERHAVLSDDYLSKLAPLERENLLAHIDISQKLISKGTKTHWKTVESIRRIKEELVPKTRRNLGELLRKEKQGLIELSSRIEGKVEKGGDAMDKELQSLTRKLAMYKLQNRESLNDLENKLREEVKRNKVIFIVNGPQHSPIKVKRPKGRPRKHKREEDIVLYKPPTINYQLLPSNTLLDDPKYRLEMQLRFIEYAYVDIERKILAESMCKLVGVTKVKNSMKFEVVFQEASQIQPCSFKKDELLKLNSLKQLSLFKFYKVSGKCLFSYISQNIAGFSHIYRNPKKPNTLKNATIPDLIEKLKTEPLYPPAAKVFNKFEMCHNCQELYMDTYLVECNYKSSKPKWESENPHAPKHRDMYVVRDGAYCCVRKYCHHCLNNSYAGRKKNGLCPYCQQICYCPRCEKQSILTRFKGIYQAAGGDVSRLQSISILAPLRRKSEEEELMIKKLQKPEIFEIDTIDALRGQMEECREICHLIRKREKQKQKLTACKRELFEKNVDFFRNELALKRDFQQMENEKEFEPSKLHWMVRGKLKKIK